MIQPKRFYTLYEIVQDGLIPGISTYIQAKNLIGADAVTNKILDGTRVPRGLKGVQYKVLGANIIKYLAQVDDNKRV